MNKFAKLFSLFSIFGMGLLLFIISCEKDPQVACNCFQGKICTEYWFNNKECLGYYEYRYDATGLLSEKLIYSNKNGTNNSEKYQYDNSGNVISIAFKIPKNGVYDTYSYDYVNGNRSVEKWRSSNEVIRTIEYSYNQWNLPEKVIHKTHDSIDSIEVFQYYNNRELYCRQKKNAKDSLLSYIRYEYFSNSLNKETHLLSNDQILFWRNTYLDSLSRPIEVKYTTPNQEYTEQKFEYKNNNLSKIETFDRNGKMILRKEFVWGE